MTDATRAPHVDAWPPNNTTTESSARVAAGGIMCEEDIEPLVKALQRKVNAQAGRITELEDRVAELERLVDPDPGTVEYDQLTKEQKVHKLRKTLVENAAQTDGRDQLKYKAVMALFDGHPSPGHCYDLMEQAARIDGFNYDQAGQGTGEKRIRVKLDGVNDETLLHAVNNGTEQTPA